MVSVEISRTKTHALVASVYPIAMIDILTTVWSLVSPSTKSGNSLLLTLLDVLLNRVARTRGVKTRACVVFTVVQSSLHVYYLVAVREWCRCWET